MPASDYAVVCAIKILETLNNTETGSKKLSRTSDLAQFSVAQTKRRNSAGHYMPPHPHTYRDAVTYLSQNELITAQVIDSNVTHSHQEALTITDKGREFLALVKAQQEELALVIKGYIDEAKNKFGKTADCLPALQLAIFNLENPALMSSGIGNGGRNYDRD